MAVLSRKLVDEIAESLSHESTETIVINYVIQDVPSAEVVAGVLACEFIMWKELPTPTFDQSQPLQQIVLCKLAEKIDSAIGPVYETVKRAIQKPLAFSIVVSLLDGSQPIKKILLAKLAYKLMELLPVALGQASLQICGSS